MQPASSKSRLRKPSRELVPELLLLGVLSQERIMLPNGRIMQADIIEYQEERYLMRAQDAGRWYDERAAGTPEAGIGREFQDWQVEAELLHWEAVK